MNKVWLIIQREFLIRVKKRSFLIATILVPLVFPVIIAGLAYVAIKEAESAKPETILLKDETNLFKLESNKKFTFVPLNVSKEEAKVILQQSDNFGLLYIPQTELNNPKGLILYTKKNQSIEKIKNLKSMLTDLAKESKMEKYKVDEETLKDIRSTSIGFKEINLSATGEEKSSDSDILFAVGMALGIMIYVFVLVYGIQIMQGVIDEKSSKIVEVIVSSVKPFQLMLGKIIGIAAVGLVQFTIWIILISILSTGVLGYFGLKMPQKQAMEQVTKQMQTNPEMKEAMDQQNAVATELLTNLGDLPYGKIAFVFVFYFIGGYLLYGALFAAVGSAVESMQESQQFQFPITIPLLIGYLGLFMFVLPHPQESPSFWLSIIPFTSPVAMVGRIASGVPNWELALSMFLLVIGFIFTTWIAGRIYRVGILMTGTKVNWKVMAKWFMMRE